MWAIFFMVASALCVGIAMRYIYQSVLEQPKYSNFIKLDSNGVCVACLRCRDAPNDTWLEVSDFHLRYLGKNYSHIFQSESPR